MKRSRPWDPDLLSEDDRVDPLYAKRVKLELMEICNDPPPGILVVYDDSDITLAHALITGPSGTPYEGGFFYFIIRYPKGYPWYPPTVKFMTTGGSTVRFNPNLYASGKVCLSILGTWEGPTWCAAMRITSLLLSIQSLLCEKPYHNEPGYEATKFVSKKVERDVQNYSDIIRYETLRVAVLGMVNNEYGLNIPQQLREEMEKNFLRMYDFYEGVVEKHIRLNNKVMKDPFGTNFGRFQYRALLQKLKSTREKLTKNYTNLTLPLKTDIIDLTTTNEPSATITTPITTDIIDLTMSNKPSATITIPITTESLGVTAFTPGTSNQPCVSTAMFVGNDSRSSITSTTDKVIQHTVASTVSMEREPINATNLTPETSNWFSVTPAKISKTNLISLTTFKPGTSNQYTSTSFAKPITTNTIVKHSRSWDPDLLAKDDRVDPMYMKRVKNELMEICTDPPPGILVVFNESDITLAHALITGPSDTPYEGGFFYFIMRYPKGYPFYPPTVKFMTTGGSTVRFNPNLYASGKVCLSILGTWGGSETWEASMRITTLLLSIQSLLGEKPYHNEPGYEATKCVGKKVEQDVQNYNDIIQHETLRVAVLGMVNNEYGLCVPQQLRVEMEKKFLQFYDFYEGVVEKNSGLNNKVMKDPFGTNFGRFQYKNLLQKLKSTRERLKKNYTNLLLPLKSD